MSKLDESIGEWGREYWDELAKRVRECASLPLSQYQKRAIEIEKRAAKLPGVKVFAPKSERKL